MVVVAPVEAAEVEEAAEADLGDVVVAVLAQDQVRPVPGGEDVLGEVRGVDRLPDLLGAGVIQVEKVGPTTRMILVSV